VKYLDEYRNPELAKKIISNIQTESDREIRLMEVCGTHTVAIFRSGIKNILPKKYIFDLRTRVSCLRDAESGD
jgi:hydrogenase expression/formation protein HypD